MPQTAGQMVDPKPFSSRPRILVADARADMRQYLTRLLSEDCQVDTAAEASTALTRARKRAPDIIVADVEMRKSRDFGSLRQLRRDPWGNVPVIFYSTASGEAAGIDAEDVATDADLIMPFSERQLLSLVHTHLRLVHMRDESIQSLRLSEDRFRTLRTAMTPGVWVTSPDGQLIGELTWWWEKQTGQTPEQYAGFGYMDAIHPADRPHVTKIRQRSLRRKSPYQIEVRVRQRDGSYRYVRIQGAAVRDADGNVREWIGTLFDIDDQKRAEEELRRSDERHRAFMAQTAVAFWRTSSSGDVVAGGYGSWGQLTGQSPDEYRGWGWLDAVHPDDRARVAEDLRHLLRVGRPIDLEYRIRRKDGTFRYVRDQGVPLRNPDGSVREWVGTIIDIDQRKKAEEELRARESRFRTLTTATTVAVWNTTAGGDVVGECYGWEELTGQLPQQYRGVGWADAVHPDDRQKTLENWQNCLRHAVPLDMKYRVRRRDGSYVHIRAQGAPVLNPDGSVREWIGTFCDID